MRLLLLWHKPGIRKAGRKSLELLPMASLWVKGHTCDFHGIFKSFPRSVSHTGISIYIRHVMTGNNEAFQQGSLLVHLSCSFWEQLPAAGCSCLKTSRQSSRLPESRNLKETASGSIQHSSPLLLNYGSPHKHPVPQPPASLCSSCHFWMLQKVCNCCLQQPKFLTHFALNMGALTGKGKIQGSGFPYSSPQPWLPCPSPQWRTDRYVLLLGKSAFLSAWRGFPYFSGDAHFRDRNQISLFPHFVTEDMTDVTWVSDVPNSLWVCVLGKYWGQMREKRDEGTWIL